VKLFICTQAFVEVGEVGELGEGVADGVEVFLQEIKLAIKIVRMSIFFIVF
jgi:hypothetical protein